MGITKGPSQLLRTFLTQAHYSMRFSGPDALGTGTTFGRLCLAILPVPVADTLLKIALAQMAGAVILPSPTTSPRVNPKRNVHCVCVCIRGGLWMHLVCSVHGYQCVPVKFLAPGAVCRFMPYSC